MKRNSVNGKSNRYAARLQHIFECDLATKEGQRKWARFFGWSKAFGLPQLQPK